jgi:hypothetical protein
LAELGWRYEVTGDVVAAREDPVRLCCGISPVEATMAFGSSDGGTTVVIEVSVPGFGPGPKRQLGDRAAGLEQRITRWAATGARAASRA